MRASDNNASYRKGVLLGLTMAEIVILIIFLLLLAFATLLDREKKSNLAINALSTKDKTYIVRIATVIDSQEPEMAEEIVRVVESLPAIIDVIKEKDLANGKSLDQAVMRGIEKLESEKTAQASINNEPIEKQLVQALEKQKELEAEVNNLRDQKQNLVSQMTNEGRGVDWPPCWSDNNKKPEYIFKVDLTNEGILIQDNIIPHRTEEKSRLPLQNVKYNLSRSQSEFRAETADLFEWSRKKECRFYVLLYDKTGESEKIRYKNLARTVEDHFYKNLINILPSKQDEVPVEKKDTSFFGGLFGKQEKKAPIKERYN